MGIAKTLGKLRQRFYWPGHKADVERWCTSCKSCEAINSSLNPKRAPLQPMPVYGRLERIACDIIVTGTTTERGNSYILVVADYFSKVTEGYAIPNMTAQTVADTLVTEFICRYGCPMVIHTDQGQNFESDLFKEICNLLDIHKTRTARYRPQSDGVVERNNRTVKKMLRAVIDENPSNWDDYLPYVFMAYRATKHETTKCSPNLLMFGTEIRLPVDIVYNAAFNETPNQCPCEFVEWVRHASSEAFDKARQNIGKAAERQKLRYDKNCIVRKFSVGQWVWVLHPAELKTKFGRAWKGPFLIIKVLNDVNYVIQQKPESKLITVHVDHVKHYTHDDVPNAWVHTE